MIWIQQLLTIALSLLATLSATVILILGMLYTVSEYHERGMKTKEPLPDGSGSPCCIPQTQATVP